MTCVSRQNIMNKFSWVIIESVLAGVGLGYALLGYLEHYSSISVALSFTFGIILSLIVIGMSASRGR